MFKAITACSTRTCSKDIVLDLVNKSNVKLRHYRPSVGILYASCFHDNKKLKDILKGISEAFPNIEIIGGTVIGGFTDDSEYTKDGYFLCLLVSDSITFTTGCIRNLSTQIKSNSLAQNFLKLLKENTLDEDPAACFLYSAYSNVEGDKLVDAVQEMLPEKCLVFGGVATAYWNEQDIANFSQKVPAVDSTLVFFAKNGIIHVEEDTLVCLFFMGNVTVKYAVSYGWSDLGTLYPGRSDGSTLTEIDGKEPHTFLREIKHPLSLEEYDHVEYPLWFHVPGKDPYIRDIFYDVATGNYYTQSSTLPSHFHISFSFPTKEKVLDEFKNCLTRIEGQNSLVIATTCCTHQVVLEQDISREYTEMVKVFHETPIICGYVFGEFGPSITSRKSMLHSTSSIICCLHEEKIDSNEKNEPLANFLNEIIREQGNEIKSLQKQLRFFEGSKNNKQKRLTEDCLGMLLCLSHKSLSGHAERISSFLKAYYEKNGIDPPYAISRNRVIEHLSDLKNSSKKFI